MNATAPTSPDNSTFIRDRWLFLLLVGAPILLFAGPLLRGGIPYFMDTMMYFFPLRWHAADLLHHGDLPLWNRTIMGGMPLFENPQAALAYPFHLPFLIWPSGFWFTFPMILQLGLFAAFTFWMLRRLGQTQWTAFAWGALCLAGGYGFSRLQYGNYMNVLPWWPLWIGAGYTWAETRRKRWLVAGAVSVGMMILAGAHQLAAYGFLALTQVWVTQLAGWGGDRAQRRRWLGYGLATAILGLGIGLPGWLPQISFIQQTRAATGLNAASVLQGSIHSLPEFIHALLGDWPALRAQLSGNNDWWADAEISTWIGPLALLAALVPPRERRLRFLWIGLWSAIIATMLLSTGPVMAALLKLHNIFGIFHGPRRILGVTQFLLIVAGGIGGASWLAAMVSAIAANRADSSRHSSEGATAEAEAKAGPQLAGFFMITVILLLLLAPPALFSAVTTDMRTIPARDLTHPETPPLLAQAHLQPGERFFTSDWKRDYSYDFRRPDALDWMLPNLHMIWGYENLGGYEPAQSPRYRDFIRTLHENPEQGTLNPGNYDLIGSGQMDSPGIWTHAWRQPYPEHFGHIQDLSYDAWLAVAQVKSALVPRWGLPLFTNLDRYIDFSEPIGDPAVTVDVLFFAESLTNLNPRLHLDQPLPQSNRVPNLRDRNPEIMDLPDSTTYEPIAVDRLSPRFDILASVDHPSSAPASLRPELAMAQFKAPSFYGRYKLTTDRPTQVVEAFGWRDAWNENWQAVDTREITTLLQRAESTTQPYVTVAKGRADVLEQHIESNKVDLIVEVTGRPDRESAATLVVFDAWWPGWRLLVDEETKPIDSTNLRWQTSPAGRVNTILSKGSRDRTREPEGMWRRFDLPPGRHKVRMIYLPSMVYLSFAGGSVSFFALLVLCLILNRAEPTPLAPSKSKS